MPSNRNQWLIAGAIVAVVVVLFAWWWWGSDRQQALIHALEEEVERVNGGDYSEVRGWMAPEFISHLEEVGVTPQQVVFLARQRDKAEQARYAYRRLQYWDAKNEDFAEAVFTRTAGGETREFALPFTYFNGRWWVTDNFRSPESKLPFLPQ